MAFPSPALESSPIATAPLLLASAPYPIDVADSPTVFTFVPMAIDVFPLELAAPPNAIEPSPSELAPTPNAVEYAPDAFVFVPNAVDRCPDEVDCTPIAIDPAPLDSVFTYVVVPIKSTPVKFLKTTPATLFA